MIDPKFLGRLALVSALAYPLLHCSESSSGSPAAPEEPRIAGQAPAGRGIPDDPYRIETLDNLLWLSQDTSAWNSAFIQTADIDASPTKGWNGGKGFSPIGSCKEYPFVKAFRGSFHGKGHAIRGLTIDRPEEIGIGMFGCIAGSARLDSIRLVDLVVKAQGWVGGLAGAGYDRSVIQASSVAGSVAAADVRAGLLIGYGEGEVVSCRTSGTVSGRNLVGGLAGQTHALLGTMETDPIGAIRFSHSDAAVQGDSVVGGLVGDLWFSWVVSSHASGPVLGIADVGGLVGHAHGRVLRSHATGAVSASGSRVGGLVGHLIGSASRSYATGAVSASGDDVGGLVGWSHISSIRSSYATGAVQGRASVGGLAGRSSGFVDTTYATGAVTGERAAGGLVGTLEEYTACCGTDTGRVSSSYWNIETTGRIVGYGALEKTVFEGRGLTTAAMKSQASFSGWDFAESWQIDDGAAYPWLRVLGKIQAASAPAP